MLSLGERIRIARHEARLTQEGLARLVHVDKDTIGRWERGENEIPPARIPTIEHVLKCDLRGHRDGVAEESVEWGTRVVAADRPEITAVPPMRLRASDGFLVVVSPEEIRLLSLHRQGKRQMCNRDEDEQ